jgi:predicted RNase H-like HicB family nuclease
MAQVETDVTVVVHEYPGEGFVAECLEIPGCLSQGETEAEALANIQDAIDSCLKVLVEDALNEVTSKRELGEINFTDISKQRRVRLRIQNVITGQAVA